MVRAAGIVEVVSDEAHAAISDTFRLSRRLSVEITVSRLGIACEWVPELPRRLRQRELAAYRRARDEMLARLAERIGGNIVVVEG